MQNAHYIKKIAYVTLIGTVFIALEAGVVFFLATLITDKADRIASREKANIAESENRIAAATLSQDYERFKEFMPRIESAFPKPPGIANMVEEIRNAAAKTGNRISIAIEGETLQPLEEAPVSFIRFSANFEGTYDGLRAFLAEFDRMSFFARIDGISLSAQETIMSEGRANLSGRMFFRQ